MPPWSLYSQTGFQHHTGHTAWLEDLGKGRHQPLSLSETAGTLLDLGLGQIWWSWPRAKAPSMRTRIEGFSGPFIRPWTPAAVC